MCLSVSSVSSVANSEPVSHVQLLFDRDNGNSLRFDAGAEFRVDVTPDLEQKLSRWLVTEQRP